MRLIDADSVGLTDFEIVMCEGDYKKAFKLLCEKLDNAPTVEAEPIRHGRWIKVEDDYNNHLYECSYCHTWTSLPTEEVNDRNIRYCWSCGAKMDR